MKPAELIREMMRIVPDLDEMHERLSQDVSAVIPSPTEERHQRAATRRYRNGVRAIVGEPGEVIDEELTRAEDRLIDRARRGAKSAVEKVKRHGTGAVLDADDILGLEAIVVWDGRPAILIQDGHFLEPPERWRRLNESRAEIEKVFESVGRVEVQGHPTLDWVGTAFMAGPNLALTILRLSKRFLPQYGDRLRR